MKNSLREKEILSRIIQILEKYLAPEAIILFGSRAKKTNANGSDFDFAVDLKRPPMKAERQMMEEIENAAGLYTVDIIYLKEVDREFKEIVLKTGEIVSGK